MTPFPVEPIDLGKDLVLVFTDMVSSSLLWESHGGKFYATLQSHMELIQEACGNNDGHLVKSTGDGFFIVFERPKKAIQFALETQISLSKHPELPSARIGIDTGEVFEVVDDGEFRDYVGPAANRAARICAVAGARSVLMSRRTALSLEYLPEGASLESVGNHSLRNIGLETLYLLKHEGIGSEYQEAQNQLSTLPWAGDLFVGRSSHLKQILTQLRSEETRCMSIVGMGGMGKTRLSLEVARRFTAETESGVVFAELDGIRDADAAWSQISSALRSIGYEGEPKSQDICAFLFSRKFILILDGMEGLTRGAELVTTLLTRTKNLRLLVSSRNRLKIPSTFVTLDSLSLPDATNLLIARLTVQDPSFNSEAELQAMTELCRRLDGIPLAIELAAARGGVMTPTQMLERIENRFAWIKDTEAPESGHRHSLETTVAWSYDLLSPSGQMALKAASLFPTGFRLDVWERVMGPESIDALGELQRSSLISTETRADQLGKVFLLLETIRLYASKKLQGDFDQRQILVVRVANDFLEQARRAIGLCRTPAEVSALRSLDDLAPNLQNVLSELIELRQFQPASAVCEVLAAFHHYSGRNRQAIEIARQGIAFNDAVENADRVTRAGLLRWLASASLDLGDAPVAAQSAQLLLKLTEILPESCRTHEQGRAHNLIGLAFTASVDPQSAAEEFEVALNTATASGDQLLEGMVLHNMGWLAFCQNEIDAAAAHLEAARVIRERLGDVRGIAETSSNLGLIELARENLPAAISLHKRSLECWSSVLDIEGMGKALFNVAECFETTGNEDAARACYASSEVLFKISDSQYLEHPHMALDRLGDSEEMKNQLADREPTDIAHWIQAWFDT